MRKDRYSPSLEERLLKYSVAAGVAVAGAATADAQIVYTDVDPDVTVSAGTYDIDLNNDGSAEFTLVQQTTGAGQKVGVNSGGGPVAGRGFVGFTTFGYNYASALSSNAPIGPGQNFIQATAISYATMWLPPYGEWNGADAYLGLTFEIAGQTHYGWARVSVPSDATSFTIYEYAYESSPGVAIDAGVIPVELTAFNAQVDGDDVRLLWETASETNNAGFEVQMKQGQDWNVLAFVDGHGTTTEAQTYAFTARDLAVGTYAFRLKQLDFDGAFEYTDEVEATVEVVGTHLLSDAYPNPFNPQAQFTLAVAREQRVSAALFNMLGQQVATLFDGTVEANAPQALTINGSNLASGTYVVRVTGETFADALRVTLAK